MDSAKYYFANVRADICHVSGNELVFFHISNYLYHSWPCFGLGLMKTLLDLTL